MPPTLYGRRPMRTLEDRHAGRSALAPTTLPQRPGMPQVQPTLLGQPPARRPLTLNPRTGMPPRLPTFQDQNLGGGYGSGPLTADNARRTAAVQPVIDQADQMLGVQAEMSRRGIPLSRESAKMRNDYYTPSLLGPQGPVEGEAGMVQQYRDQQRVAGSGPYDSQSALARFNGLAGAPAVQPAQMTPPALGTRYSGGSTVAATPDGRQYLQGLSRPSPQMVAASGRADTARASGSAFAWMGRNEQTMDAVARRASIKNGIDPNLPPEQRNASLREAAIARHAGEKQQRLAFRQQRAGFGSGAAGLAQGGTRPGLGQARPVAPASVAERSAAREASAAQMQSPVVVDAQERLGFDPAGSAHDVAGVYTGSRDQWSPEDKAEFDDYVVSRYDNPDEEEFKAEVDDILGMEEYTFTQAEDGQTVGSQDELDRYNELRRVFGQPPLPVKRNRTQRPAYLPPASAVRSMLP